MTLSEEKRRARGKTAFVVSSLIEGRRCGRPDAIGRVRFAEAALGKEINRHEHSKSHQGYAGTARSRSHPWHAKALAERAVDARRGNVHHANAHPGSSEPGPCA